MRTIIAPGQVCGPQPSRRFSLRADRPFSAAGPRRVRCPKASGCPRTTSSCARWEKHGSLPRCTSQATEVEPGEGQAGSVRNLDGQKRGRRLSAPFNDWLGQSGSNHPFTAPRWGEITSAELGKTTSALTEGAVRPHPRTHCPSHAAMRHGIVVDSGKPERENLRQGSADEPFNREISAQEKNGEAATERRSS